LAAAGLDHRRNAETCETAQKSIEEERPGDSKLERSRHAKGVPITPRMGRVKFREIAEDIVKDYEVNGKRPTRDD
jgi:hypothetical protein